MSWGRNQKLTFRLSCRTSSSWSVPTVTDLVCVYVFLKWGGEEVDNSGVDSDITETETCSERGVQDEEVFASWSSSQLRCNLLLITSFLIMLFVWIIYREFWRIRSVQPICFHIVSLFSLIQTTSTRLTEPK